MKRFFLEYKGIIIRKCTFMLRNILLVHIELSFRTIARAEILILNIVAISTYYSEGINS